MADKQLVRNWRWWVTLPLVILILPFAFLLSGITWAYEWFHFTVSNGIVRFLRRADRSGVIKPLHKWVHGGSRDG